jgi:hypothetical protein
MGTKKGEASVTVNRVKGPESTNSFFEKDLSFGGKRMVVEIHVDVDAESKTMDMTYKTTEQSFFRGHHDKKGPFMIDDKCFFKLDDMSKFKKDLKKKFDEYAVREANYFIKTKLGIEDRVEKSINSMVESNMNKLSLKDILSGDFDETLDKIMESTKKDKEEKVDQNHPEVKDANSPGNLLFDDLKEDEEEKNVEWFFNWKDETGSPVGFNTVWAKNREEAISAAKAMESPAREITYDIRKDDGSIGQSSERFKGMYLDADTLRPIDGEESARVTRMANMMTMEENLDEVTASAGGAGAGAYQTPGAFAKGGDFDDEMKDSPEKKNIHEELQKKFEETAYAKRGTKRTLKREGNPDGWTTVELEPGSGYVPKGMNKNHALGLHGVEVNSKEEDKLSKGSPKGRAGMKGKAALGESFDPGKKKFITESEHKDKGVNKRYIITHKPTAEEESNKWAKLANFEKNSTIRLAESCGCPVDDGTNEKMVSREQGEQENEREFMQRNNGVDAGDSIDGKAVIVVGKPGSLSGAEFKVFEEDYLNENKAFILDMNSGNLVNNPNYKRPETISESVEKESETLNENAMPKMRVEEQNIPNTAYYYNTELGKLVRNPNYKA